MSAVPSVRGFSPASRPARTTKRVDPIRIMGYSSAIAINTIAAGLLLMPLQAPPPAPPPDPPAVWILPATPPAPVLPPPIATPRPPTELPRVVPTPVTQAPPVVAPVIVDQGTLPATVPAEPTQVASIEPAPAATGPAPMTLEYAVASSPPYPRASLRNGDEGLVMLQVLVDVDGRPLEVEVVDGSGHRELDQAARRHVLANWRFRPATRDGHPVQAIGLVPIDFRLD